MDEGGGRKEGRVGETVRVDSVTPGTREQHRGFTSNQDDVVAAAQSRVNTAASAAEHTKQPGSNGTPRERQFPALAMNAHG